MSKWKQKRKKWHDRNCRKCQLDGKQDFKYGLSHIHKSSHKGKKGRLPVKVISAPHIFSLKDNTEETMIFFNTLIDEIRHKEYKKIIYIDSENVEKVSVDVLIYLIAIMQNDRINYQMKYTYKGNLPKNESANKIYQESGFMSYVSSKMKKLPKSTEKVQIVSGKKNDPIIAKQFCIFAMEKLQKERREMIPLQVILIELMSNVYHHAYGEDEVMAQKWYMYAEHIADHIHFVFVDTGMGITRTIRKNFSEKIKNIFSSGCQDGALLKSAFEGEFRTRTLETNRGNGLNTVRKKVLEGKFNDFEVLSGKGRCLISSKCNNIENMEYYNYNNSACGTLYMFDVY